MGSRSEEVFGKDVIVLSGVEVAFGNLASGIGILQLSLGFAT